MAKSTVEVPLSPSLSLSPVILTSHLFVALLFLFLSAVCFPLTYPCECLSFFLSSGQGPYLLTPQEEQQRLETLNEPVSATIVCEQPSLFFQRLFQDCFVFTFPFRRRFVI
jgi:hypothetical protein